MNNLKFITLAIIAFVLGILLQRSVTKSSDCDLCLIRDTVTISDPPSLQMYFNIEKYAEKYRIPKRFAYGIAYAETRYEGPFHWKYRSAQTSHAGAVGPMQIMPTTADMMWPKTKVSRDRLKTDIAFNVETSMKLLRRLHDRYGDWKIVFGCYNTGRPMINGYSEMVYNHQPKWNTD